MTNKTDPPVPPVAAPHQSEEERLDQSFKELMTYKPEPDGPEPDDSARPKYRFPKPAPAAVAAPLSEQHEALDADNREIEHQRTLQRMQVAGELLEMLTFWPSPTSHQNLARDIGCVLQGKPPQRSVGIEEELSAAGAFVMSWKQKAEAAASQVAAERATVQQLTQELADFQMFYDGVLEGIQEQEAVLDAERATVQQLEDAFKGLQTEFNRRVEHLDAVIDAERALRARLEAAHEKLMERLGDALRLWRLEAKQGDTEENCFKTECADGLEFVVVEAEEALAAARGPARPQQEEEKEQTQDPRVDR